MKTNMKHERVDTAFTLGEVMVALGITGLSARARHTFS